MRPGHDTVTIREDGSDVVRWEFAEDGDADAAAVWDRVMSAHDLDGSFGQRLRELFPQHWGVE